jgi:hypothetical protein
MIESDINYDLLSSLVDNYIFTEDELRDIDNYLYSIKFDIKLIPEKRSELEYLHDNLLNNKSENNIMKGITVSYIKDLLYGVIEDYSDTISEWNRKKVYKLLDKVLSTKNIMISKIPKTIMMSLYKLSNHININEVIIEIDRSESVDMESLLGSTLYSYILGLLYTDINSVSLDNVLNSISNSDLLYNISLLSNSVSLDSLSISKFSLYSLYNHIISIDWKEEAPCTITTFWESLV